MIRAFNHREDYPLFESLCKHHGIDPIAHGFLPRLGAIADEKAIAFGYRTDSQTAFIDHLIVSPDLRHEDRTKAIDEIMEFLEAKLAECGHRLIIGLTGISTVENRAKKIGYEHVGSVEVFTKLLEEKDSWDSFQTHGIK